MELDEDLDPDPHYYVCGSETLTEDDLPTIIWENQCCGTEIIYFWLRLRLRLRLRLQLQLLLLLTLKTVLNSSTVRNMSQWRIFFILASSKLPVGNIY